MPPRVRNNNTKKITQKPRRKAVKKLSVKKQSKKKQQIRRQGKRQSKKSTPKKSKTKMLKKYNAKGGRTGTGGSISTTIGDMLATGASLADTIGSATALVMDSIIFPFDMGVAFLASNPPNPANTGMI